MGLIDILDSEIQTDPTPAMTAPSSPGTGGDLLQGIQTGWPEGQRNAGLTRLAGLLRSRGLAGEMIESLLQTINRGNGTNLPSNEVTGIARSVRRYTPKPENVPCADGDILTVAEAGQKWATLRKQGRTCRSGFPLLDGSIPYFQVGEVFTIAGRSGTCKTTAGLQIGRGIAKSMNGHCLFCSLEMDSAAVFFRLGNIHLSESRGVPVDSFETARQLDATPALTSEVSRKYDSLLIVDKDSLSLEKIEEYLVLARDKFGNVPVVCIDYLGYINDSGGGSNYDKVSRIARGIKSLAKRQQVRAILLCQTSRAGQAGSEPVQLHHLRDSGAIEESADYIMGLWHSSEQNRLHGEILKARHAQRGQRLDFINQGLFLVESEFKPEPKKSVNF
jgi:replicative DNA helicase